jgi:hypothetical protein
MGAAAGQQQQHQQQQHYGAAAGSHDPSRSNVLLVHIDDVEYTPTLDALHTVFKTYGHVQKMTIFDKGGHWQVRAVACCDVTASVAELHADLCCLLTCWLVGLNRMWGPVQLWSTI